MAYDTVILQGRFTSDGSAKTLALRSDVDWIEVYNYTQAATQQATGRGVQFYWQRGMAVDTGLEYVKTNSTDALNLVTLTSGGFTLIDTSIQTPGTLNATITAISTANPPVVSNSGTNGLIAGDVVRIINVAGAQQLGGFDFTVGYGTLTTGTFSLDYMSVIAAGTTGSWRKINFDPIFYPRRRYITKITKAAQAVVSLSVTHGYKVGQLVRFVVPAAFGMVEMDGLTGTIVAVNTATTAVTGNTITVNIDSTAFTTFAWPLTTDVPFTAAEVVPVGEDTGFALSAGVDILTDATINEAILGIRLAAGAQSPAGSASDVIYWKAGKSFSVDNQ